MEKGERRRDWDGRKRGKEMEGEGRGGEGGERREGKGAEGLVEGQ
jgi:hypothetical protein